MLTLQCASAQIWYEKVYQLLLPTIKDAQESKAVTQRLLAHYLGYNLTDHLLGKVLRADGTTLAALNNALQRLKKHEPIQYILGCAPFLSYNLHVNPHVLIPRPETEEMVSTILHENELQGTHVLDIGTGSGCIAIALKKGCKSAHVEGLDVSAKALDVAKKNAEVLGAKIDWYQIDFLREALPAKKWDFLVSNPPYIPLVEKPSMPLQVVDYEPSLALFVPDDDPLLFYQRLAGVAKVHLRRKGKLYAECHEDMGESVKALFLQHGFEKVRIYHDLQGKERWLSVCS